MTGYVDWEKEIERLEEVIGEQQAIIHRDEMSIKTMMSNMEKLEKENEQLKQELAELLVVHTKIVETLDSEFVSKALEDGD